MELQQAELETLCSKAANNNPSNFHITRVGLRESCWVGAVNIMRQELGSSAGTRAGMPLTSVQPSHNRDIEAQPERQIDWPWLCCGQPVRQAKRRLGAQLVSTPPFLATFAFSCTHPLVRSCVMIYASI